MDGWVEEEKVVCIGKNGAVCIGRYGWVGGWVVYYLGRKGLYAW